MADAFLPLLRRDLVLAPFFLLLICASLLLPVGLVAEEPTPPRRPLVQSGHCLDVSEDLVGLKAVTIGDQLKQPEKLRHFHPHYPTRETPTVGTGSWLGEFLIGADGTVQEVWPIREVVFEPPWPEFNDAIVDAIEKWEYSPTEVDGKPTPVCMTVTVHINWR